ncbi:MAG: DUF190 domain-containing protein [Gemmatimonadales bacterium]|nr:MAG: DUF190 domain-containing protein [Gemmatimonadales bacterium]
MSRGIEGERTLMRVFIGENDRCPVGPHRGKPLYEAILLTLRERSIAGATVLRGITGFGASARIHTDKILRLSLDLPLIIEVVEEESVIQEILPILDPLISGGLITLEKARVVLYRPSISASE